MALRDKINSIIKGNRVIGLNVDFCHDGTVVCNMLWLKKINSSLSYEKSESLNPDELEGLNEGKLPVVLCFTGSNVIIKKVEETDTASMLSNLIPQGRTEEFFYDLSPAERGYMWLSVIRKDIVKEVVESLKSKKLFVAGLCLGPFDVGAIVTGIEGIDGSLMSGGYRLLFEGNPVTKADSKIIEVNLDKEREETYRIGEEEISSNYLPAYAAAVTFFTGKEIEGVDEELERDIKDYSYYRNFRALYVGLGVFILTALFINFLVFSSFSKRYDNLSRDAVINRGMLVKLDSLKEDVKRYKGVIASNSLDRKSNMSVFCDRLIMKMPDGIRLRKLSVCPLVSKQREGKALKYKDGVIHIEGKCGDPKNIDIWLSYLKDEDWLESVLRQEYFEREGQGEFVLELKILSKR